MADTSPRTAARLPLLRRNLERPQVWLPAEILATLTAQANEHRPHETGGMLIGWRIGEDIVVAGTIDGGPRARRERDSFEADGEWQERQLAAIYRESARTLTYLGDWHSHPRGRGRPSAQDRETAALVADAAEARAPEPLTMILARRAGRWRPRCYVYARRRMRRARSRVHHG
jgi:integrative and conjugative element protein (TIGR02256 family)